MSEKTRAELKEQIKIMNHNYQVIKEMHEKGYQYSVGEIKRLQDELERTRKALGIAVNALKTVRRYTAINQFAPKSREAHIVAKKAVAEITALEQKD